MFLRKNYVKDTQKLYTKMNTNNHKHQHIVWHDDVLMKQLISYAIGCMMGRYRLDQPGLWIAHPNPTDEEICTYHYNGND